MMWLQAQTTASRFRHAAWSFNDYLDADERKSWTDPTLLSSHKIKAVR